MKRAIKREEIYKRIDAERDRQERLHPILKLKKDQDDEIKTITTLINNGEMLAVLVEELGEVARALQGEGKLDEELIQMAAVCCRWLEYKDPAE